MSQYAVYTVLGTIIWATFFGRENPASEDLYFSHEHNLCLVRHDEVFSYVIPTQPPVKVITKKQNNRMGQKKWPLENYEDKFSFEPLIWLRKNIGSG